MLEMSAGRIKSEIFNGAYEPGLSLKEFIQNEVKKRSLNANLLDFGALPMRKTEAPSSFADVSKVKQLLETRC